MEFEVLSIEDCPNSVEATNRLREALTVAGYPSVPVAHRVLRAGTDVDGTAFAGSPTITLDGEDLFPTDAAISDLACRIYSTPDGLAGMPTVDQIVERINSHGR